MPKVKAEDRILTSAYADVRALAEFNEDKNNCAVVAVAFVCGLTYVEAEKALKDAGREMGKPTKDEVIEKAIKAVGGKLKEVDMQEVIEEFPAPHDNLKNLTLHHPVRFKDEWPEGVFLAFSKGHVSAIVHGEVHDHARGSTKRLRRLVQVIMPSAESEESPQTEEDELAVAA